ncbi:MAG: Hsp20/alpha crystallin family protein [Cytophagales bacterium]|nr:Hsp20/alpha crystallin family protein [Cytophagales bacterium]
MAIIKRDPGASLFQSMFDDFFNRDLTHFREPLMTIPKVNIEEKDDRFEIEMAAPGMKKDDFKIELHHQVLSISSEKKSETEKNKKGFSRKEYSYSSFQRSFQLPPTAEDEKIEAKYEDGILKILIPKTESGKKKEAKKIDVK